MAKGNLEEFVPPEWRAQGCKTFQDIEDLQAAEYDKGFQQRRKEAKGRSANDPSFVNIYADSDSEEEEDSDSDSEEEEDSDSDSEKEENSG